jgi:hypothetical protein
VILAGVVVLTLLSVFLIFQPLLMGQKAPMGEAESDYSDLAHRKRMALLALRDVEYDFHAGKLDEEDYRTLKAQVAAEALEALEAEAEAVSRSGARGTTRTLASDASMAAVEAEIAEMRRSIREGSICTQCGHPNPRGSRFCAECGTALAVPGATPV